MDSEASAPPGARMDLRVDEGQAACQTWLTPYARLHAKNVALRRFKPTHTMKKTHPVDRLYKTIASRKKADPTKSYTAKLLKKGVAQCAKKLGEESVEA